MIYRQSYILNDYTLADAGELVQDINVVDPITCLWVIFKATNGSTSNKANVIADVIDTFEVIDGSDVIVSLDGYELFALSSYVLQSIPPQCITEEADAEQSFVVMIPFGRYYGDQQFAFDPNRFTNPQLRISWDLANIRAVGATGFVSGTASLTVIAHIMEGAGAPAGVLTAKEHYTFTTAASGVEYIDLPTDYDYLAMLLRAYYAGTAFSGILSAMKLNCDQNKVVPFDVDMEDFLDTVGRSIGPFSYKHTFLAADGDTIYTILKDREALTLNVEETGDTVAVYNSAGVGQGALQLDTGGSPQSSDTVMSANVLGFLPFGVLYVPFGSFLEETTWFPVSQFRSVRLELTQATASGVAAVVLVQRRPY